jgi:hypothetical protein
VYTQDEIELLEQYMADGYITLACGCDVEVDGSCACGNESPLISAGIV